MNQETTTTLNPMSYENNPEIGRILALGLKPSLDPPVLKVATPDGMNITMQPDGQIALYTGEGLFACECKGVCIPALPERAVLKASLRRDSVGVAVYQSGINFYTKRRGRVTKMSVTDYSPNYPKAGNGGDDGPDIDEDKLDDYCGIFHTDDDCIDDDITDPLAPVYPDED